MKKFALVIALLAISTMAFAEGIEMSAGAGLNFNQYSNTLTVKVGSDAGTQSFNYSMLGFSAFFDATYVMANVGYSMVVAGKMAIDFADLGGPTDEIELDGEAIHYLSLGLAGKYPIAMGGFTLFPFAGFEYALNMKYEDADGNDMKDGMSDDEIANLNMLFIKAGVGADFNITDKIYVRPIVDLGYKIPSKLESDQVKDAEDSGADSAGILGLKLDIGIFAGYKF